MGKLVLSRRVGERIAIDETTFVSVERIRGDYVRLGFEAPRHVRIVRDELERIDDAKPFEPYQQRVVDEKTELDGKYRKLIEFIEESPTFPRLPDDEQNRLRRQKDCMKNYSDVLGERISAFPCIHCNGVGRLDCCDDLSCEKCNGLFTRLCDNC